MAYETSPIFVIQTIVGIIGLFGNCLVCIVIWRTPAMHTTTNAFIFNQATVDFLGSIFMLLSSVVPVPEILPSGTAGVILCRIWISNYFLWACYVTSSFNLVALTFERYLAIVYPFKFQKVCHRLGAIVVIVFVWVAGYSVALYAVEIYRFREGLCLRFFDPKLRVVGTMIPGFQYFFPVVSMLVAYIHITVELKRSARRLARIMGPSVAGDGTSAQVQESADESLLRARRNTFKTLLMVFIAYITCWTLNASILLAGSLGYPSADSSAHYIISVSLVAANSAVNPIIYAFKYKQFQIGLRKMFKMNNATVDAINPSTAITLA
ncbi:kappa-type opioid receptor-like [Asterias rubens]|uniref:kappa-type opioid receptor-like n=1 Tax=Asterias rubens TaxID=7604 RepID=UPI00145558D1|nr:kappa-type opioid receptor-like [Asterias rubens]